MSEFTPAEEAWLTETLSRAGDPTVEQLDTIRAAFRRAARNRPELPPAGEVQEMSAGTPPASALQGRGALAGTY